MKGRGYIRKSLKVAIAATVDESEDVYGLDELDAFADTTNEVDVAEMGLRVKPESPMTALNSADAEDLRAFLEAERRRKQLCGSDVEEEEEEEDAVQNQVVEREIINLVSEDELDNWDVDESSIVVPKQEDSDKPFSTSNFQTPSIRQTKSETLRRSPRKRICPSSESDNLPRQDQPPTVYKIPDNKVVKNKSPRRSSSQSQRPRPSPKFSVSSVVVLKQDDTDIPSSTGNFRSPSISQAESNTLRRSSRKRNRVSSDFDDLPCQDQPSTVYKIPDNKVIKHKAPRSQGPRPSPKSSVSSVFVLIPSSTSNFRSPSIPQAESEILQRSPRKRNRHSSDPNDLPCQDQPPTVFKIPDIIDNKVVKQKAPRRSPPRSQGPRPSPKSSMSSVVLKQDGGDIPPSTSNFRSPSTPQAESKTLQRSPRKRNRVSSDSNDLPCQDQPPTVYKIPDNKVVKQKAPRRSSSRSQGLSPKLSVSKQDDSDIPSSTGNFRSPSIPETLRRNPRKRNRVSSDSDDLPCQDQPPTVYKIPDIIDNKVVKHKSPRPSSSLSQRPRPSPKLSVSGSESESGYSEHEYNHTPSRSHYDGFQHPYRYPYAHRHQSYIPSPHRNQQQQNYPSEMFAPPIHDPRAQFIIAQAMHQLSALASTPWTPPHDSSYIPQTPSRRHQSRRANSIFNTPNHPHPYPYSYDPNLSIATLPAESSPEPISSPEKLSSSSSSQGPRKSSMARTSSRSRMRQVSFVEIDRSGDDRVGSRSEPD